MRKSILMGVSITVIILVAIIYHQRQAYKGLEAKHKYEISEGNNYTTTDRNVLI
ncbi:MAG: hypothetical protein ACPG49_04075 [Chitinophagales bacterium]